MRRVRVRRLFLVFVALIALEIGSCQVFDAVVEFDDPQGLTRADVESGAGWTVSYLEQNPRDPGLPLLIFVHGSPGNAAAFDSYLLDPIPGFDAVSIDRPGYGKTRPMRPALTLREQAQCIEPLLEARDGVWPILIGHSLGGPIVAQAAVDFSGRVGGVVILSGSMDPELEHVGWYQYVADFAFVPYMIPRFVRHSNRELMPLAGELELLQPRLSEVDCPVIVVHAPDDILVPFENVGFMLRNFSAESMVDIVVVEGKDHFIPWNAELEVREAIERVAQAAKERAGATR